MSAIFGILRFDGAAVNPRDLERMGNTLAHRGPDGRKYVVDGPIGLGHCLMRVNNEDLFEAQPLYDREADLTLVADCRIDNREELAEAFGLSAADIRDMPDSAFILRAYKKWGEDAAEHLLGDFAFAIWDGRAKKLVLARDHMGQRYVHHHRGKGFFAFSTEAKGLWALPDVPRALRDEALGRLLVQLGAHHDPGGTLFREIFGVPGGTIRTITRDGKAIERRYWQPRADPRHVGRDEGYYIEQYRAVFGEAVACRLRRLTRPAALMLSAGFDSAAIAGLAGPVVRSQGRKLIAFTIMADEAYRTTNGDSRRWVEACRRVMPHLDARYVSQNTLMPFDEIEKRFIVNQGMATLNDATENEICKLAATAGARLLMDGMGGDYTINPRGRAALARWLRKGRLLRFLSELGPHMRQTRESFWQVLRAEIIGKLLPRRIVRAIKGGINLSDYPIEPEFLQALVDRGAVQLEREAFKIPQTEMRAETRYYSNLVSTYARTARAGRAGAFELDFTRPLHDKRIVEFGLAIPEDLYVKNGRNRHLACKALGDVYPPEFQTRGRGNDAYLAGFETMLNAAMPELLSECKRLSTNDELARCIDFENIRRVLTLCGGTDREKETKKRFAIRGLLLARYVEWFVQRNLP